MGAMRVLEALRTNPKDPIVAMAKAMARRQEWHGLSEETFRAWVRRSAKLRLALQGTAGEGRSRSRTARPSCPGRADRRAYELAVFRSSGRLAACWPPYGRNLAALRSPRSRMVRQSRRLMWPFRRVYAAATNQPVPRPESTSVGRASRDSRTAAVERAKKSSRS